MLRSIAAVSVCTLLIAAGPALAQPTGEEPRWLRFARISPDGEAISFTHRGQVFVVAAEGGVAIPISSQQAYSHHAVWSPDSERLAFASDIGGDDDVYVSDFSGTLQRMTWSSASEVPTSFSADGQSVLYEALRLGDAEQSVQGALSGLPQLYAVDTGTGRDRLVLPNLAGEASWNQDQTALVYTYNPSFDPPERQYRVAANARQIWIYRAATGNHERLFPVDGVDRLNPVWSADGQSLFYLSEASGRLNVWRVDLSTMEETQLTRYSDEAVRYLSVANDGTIAFTHGGRIYTMAPGAEEATAIEILTLDQRTNNRANYYAQRSQGFASSPDGTLFAHIANTDVFLSDTEGDYRRITDTPGEERDITFSPDGSLLVYAAQRDHQWGLYAVDLSAEDGAAGLALNYEEQALLVPENGNFMGPEFSPDGGKIAFIADRREVQVLDLETGEVTVLFGAGDYNSTYFDGNLHFSWSPNSTELAVDWNTIDASELRRVAIVPADGSAAPRPIGTVTDLSGYTWSADGTQIIGSTTLYGARDAQLHAEDSDLYRIFVSEAARQDFLDRIDGTTADADQEDEGVGARSYPADSFRSRRLEGRLTSDLPGPVGLLALEDPQYLLAPTFDGETLDLNVVDLATGEQESLASLSVPNLQDISFVPGAGLVDLKIPGQILRVPLAQPDQRVAIATDIFFTRDEQAARHAAFGQAWADIKYRFYDGGLEGRNWDTIGEKYRAFVPSVATNRELVSLIAAMLGELSASHLFVSFHGVEGAIDGIGTHNDALGVYLDHGYTGEGRRIAAVLPGGPLDRQSLGIEAGDIISSINGQPVPEAGGLDRLLDLNVGRQALVGIIDLDGDGTERIVQVKPISLAEEQMLAKRRLLDARAEMVQRLSKACIAYQYLPAMETGPYLDLLGTLSAARNMAKAAIIDVRSNGGGNLTRELITLLSGTAYSTLGRDDGALDYEPNNRWLWPSAVVVDSFGYSDGSVFPQAYQDNELGKLVGDTVLNTGTAVNYVESRIVPGLVYGIPVLPNRRLDGSYYENHVIHPEIHVPFDPNTLGLNTDPQLEAAVASLMEEIGVEADCRR
ncbi:S41 family peptidase [Devosia albogilva]|uniref:Tricorn protease homolog n=1 Tax=Devosia albogilva TaxID=429726 RepID=A0ABW5QNZ4_9HYPH